MVLLRPGCVASRPIYHHLGGVRSPYVQVGGGPSSNWPVGMDIVSSSLMAARTDLGAFYLGSSHDLLVVPIVAASGSTS